MSDSPTRVQRRHQATLADIVLAGRTLLRAGCDVSISAVAGHLGVTPPALYRYVPSLTGLLELVTQAIMTDVIQRMTNVVDRQEDPAARLIAAATAFRQWALNNPHEFRLAFSPRDPLAHIPTPEDPQSAVERSSALFLRFFQAVGSSYPMRCPDDDEVPPAYFSVAERLSGRRGHPEGATGNNSIADIWQFERVWLKFIGVICCEVFGFVPPELVVSGDMFVLTCIEIGRDLGLADEFDRLLAIAVETAQWTDDVDGVDPLHVTAARLRTESI